MILTSFGCNSPFWLLPKIATTTESDRPYQKGITQTDAIDTIITHYIYTLMHIMNNIWKRKKMNLKIVWHYNKWVLQFSAESRPVTINAVTVSPINGSKANDAQMTEKWSKQTFAKITKFSHHFWIDSTNGHHQIPFSQSDH